MLVLASHFLGKMTSAEDAPPGKADLVFGEEAATALVNHDWPGNVRELQNRVHRAVLVAAPATRRIRPDGRSKRR